MRISVSLGFVETSEVRPGIWEETVTEVPALGELRQRTEALDGSDTVLPRYRTTTSVSVPARGVGHVDNSSIRYVKYSGERWVVSTIVDEYPRIVIYVGEVYNGPTPE